MEKSRCVVGGGKLHVASKFPTRQLRLFTVLSATFILFPFFFTSFHLLYAAHQLRKYQRRILHTLQKELN